MVLEYQLSFLCFFVCVEVHFMQNKHYMEKYNTAPTFSFLNSVSDLCSTIFLKPLVPRKADQTKMTTTHV